MQVQINVRCKYNGANVNVPRYQKIAMLYRGATFFEIYYMSLYAMRTA